MRARPTTSSKAGTSAAWAPKTPCHSASAPRPKPSPRPTAAASRPSSKCPKATSSRKARPLLRRLTDRPNITMPTPLRTRRRFLGITAAASALALAPGALRLAHATATAQPAHGIEPLHWRGVALGADAELRLYHPNPAAAQR